MGSMSFSPKPRFRPLRLQPQNKYPRPVTATPLRRSRFRSVRCWSSAKRLDWSSAKRGEGQIRIHSAGGCTAQRRARFRISEGRRFRGCCQRAVGHRCTMRWYGAGSAPLPCCSRPVLIRTRGASAPQSRTGSTTQRADRRRTGAPHHKRAIGLRGRSCRTP